MLMPDQSSEIWKESEDMMITVRNIGLKIVKEEKCFTVQLTKSLLQMCLGQV